MTLRSGFGLLSLLLCLGANGQEVKLVAAEDVNVTLLATNLSDYVETNAGPATPTGEFSFSAWVEIGGRSFLFDTGWSPRNVLRNAELLGIELSEAQDLILSHHHYDHVGGIETLRLELKKRNPLALSRIHVADGMFASRPEPDGREDNLMIGIRERMEADGVAVYIHSEPQEIAPGVWVSGPIPRVHDERNYPVGPDWMMVGSEGVVPDWVPESQVMIVQTTEGPVVVTGCGHAGLINSLDYAAALADASPLAAIGGFHLFGASQETMSWTADHLRKMQLKYMLPAHCTGVERAFTLRELTGMRQSDSRVGSVGTRFNGRDGIAPGASND